MNDYEQICDSQNPCRTDSSCAPTPRARAGKSPAAKDRPRVARQAMSIKEFCDAHGVGRTTFYKLLKAGLAPRLMAVGGATRISAEAAAEWRRRMEDAARQQSIDSWPAAQRETPARNGGADEEA